MIIDDLPVTKYKSFVFSLELQEENRKDLQNLEELISAEELFKTEDEEIVVLVAATKQKGKQRHG